MTDITNSNFVSEQDFEKLINSIPIPSTSGFFQPKLEKREDWQMLFRIMYGCALRITEITTLTPKNFDLDNKVLSLFSTKTGWKHCKCSKWKTIKNSRQSKLIYADKKCKKCHGDGWVRIPQKTTILEKDVKLLKRYFLGKTQDEILFPISRQSIWIKFKQMCDKSNLHYHFEKRERAFKDNPYLLRSSRAKIMEQLHAPHSYVKLKLRHAIGGDVTLAYTMPDISALLGWEAEHYTKELIA